MSSWMDNQLNSYKTTTRPVAPAPVQNNYTPSFTSPTNTPVNVNLLQKQINAKPATGGLGWIGEQLSKPSKWAGEKITSGRGYEKYLNEDKVGQTVSSFLTPQFAKDYAKRMGKEKEGMAGANKALAMAAPFVIDPLNALPGAGAVLKGVSKIPKVAAGVAKAGEGINAAKTAVKTAPLVQKAVQTAKTTEKIYKPIETFINPGFRNPEAYKILETGKRNALQKASQLTNDIEASGQGLTRDEQIKIGELIEGKITPGKTDTRYAQVANEFRRRAEEIGKEMVDAELLDKAAYEKHKGVYMHHMWNSASTGEDMVNKLSGWSKGSSNLPKIDLSTTKFRTGKEGYEQGYMAPTLQGLGTETRNVEMARAYKEVAGKFGVKLEKGKDIPSGYLKASDELTSAKGVQILKDEALPTEVIDYIKRLNPTGKPGMLDGALKAWKAAVTIWNPAYHVRNLASNQMLGASQTGQNMIEHVGGYVGAVKNYLGKNGAYYKEATDVNLIRNKNFGQTLEEFLGNAGKSKNVLQKGHAKLQGLQSFSEDTAKLNVYSVLRDKGYSIEKAKDLAEEAIFSPYRLNPNEREALTKFLPFYSFYRQAFPFVGKKILTHPERFTKYPKAEQAFESLSQPQDESNMPDYMKDYTRTPLKDKKGNQQYTNLQYFYPWGSFYGGDTLPTPSNFGKDPVKTATMGLGLNPLLSMTAGLLSQKDPFYKTDITRSGMTTDQKVMANIGYAVKSLAPSFPKSIATNILPTVKDALKGKATPGDVGSKTAQVLSGLKLYSNDEAKNRQGAYYGKQDIQTGFTTEVKIWKKKLVNGEITQAEFQKELQKLIQNRREQLLK
jgi:hypothetical protein